MKQACGIIPARYGAHRFPGKPLAPILGKPMIQWVYERAGQARSLDKLIVATDDRRIFDACKSFGADVRRTSSEHKSGTERVAEVAEGLESPIIVNIQGDEPLINPLMIDDLIQALQENSVSMVTLAAKTEDLDKLEDSNIVKVVMDGDKNALYFSRSPIPHRPTDYFWQHIGIYGYQRDFLLKFCSLRETRLEKTEKLEQLRVLESGYRIKIIETQHPGLSVDTPADIIKVENFLNEQSD
ncbi:MAG: 3-deoxy-manno-octulosonate cytidylyltransferase [Candidatus Aminicenantes bacterium]